MHKNFYLSLFLVISVFLASCQKDEDDPQTDFSIESNEFFKVINQHQNGWIKQGEQIFGYPESKISKEFEYYENGFIKSAKIYSNHFQRHLYMEVSRSEDNKPLWSKYYNPEGELWFETEYSEGFPNVKKVYSEGGTAVYNYINGDLTSVEFTSANNSINIITTYNAAAGSRNVRITSNGQIVLQEEYPYLEQVGAGVYENTDVPVANAFGTMETNYININQSYFSSPKWELKADPLEFIFPYRLHYGVYSPHSDFSTKFAVSTELYQSVIEQYPVTENGVLMGGGYYEDGYKGFFPATNQLDSLKKVHEDKPELYELKYGKEYIDKLSWGKNHFVIGAVRNLPTDASAAEKVKTIARKRMDQLLGANTSLTTEEMQILNKVWFEVKFFSSLKEHRNGIVIDAAEKYNNAIEMVNTAESSVIQLEYQPFEFL